MAVAAASGCPWSLSLHSCPHRPWELSTACQTRPGPSLNSLRWTSRRWGTVEGDLGPGGLCRAPPQSQWEVGAGLCLAHLAWGRPGEVRPGQGPDLQPPAPSWQGGRRRQL